MLSELVYFESERVARQLIDQSGFPAFLETLPLWGKPIPAMRHGDTAVGFTFEQLLGVQENNKKHPDLYGYEAKATASDQSHITLFTRNPTAPLRAVHLLVDQYGKPEATFNRLNTNLIVGRKTAFRNTFLTLRYDDNLQQLEVISDDQGIVAYWSLEDMMDSANKLTNLMLCIADRYVEDGMEYFKYSKCILYSGFDIDRFVKCIRNGKISIHFRIKGTSIKARNKGVAFRIHRRDVVELYSLVTDWP